MNEKLSHILRDTTGIVAKEYGPILAALIEGKHSVVFDFYLNSGIPNYGQAMHLNTVTGKEFDSLYAGAIKTDDEVSVLIEKYTKDRIVIGIASHAAPRHIDILSKVKKEGSPEGVYYFSLFPEELRKFRKLEEFLEEESIKVD